MPYRLPLLIVVLTLVACSGDDNTTDTNPDADEMIETGSMANEALDREPSETGEVTVDASVRLWTESNLTVDYTVSNNGSLELIVFDVGSNAFAALQEDGQVRLLKAKIDTGDTDFEQPPTIAGRNLSPAQTLSGSFNRRLPISIDFSAPLISGLDPDAIEFCLGYGNADDVIPTTLVDGTFPLNADLELQSLACTLLERP